MIQLSPSVGLEAKYRSPSQELDYTIVGLQLTCAVIERPSD
jgi:hypothetical protein